MVFPTQREAGGGEGVMSLGVKPVFHSDGPEKQSLEWSPRMECGQPGRQVGSSALRLFG